MQIILISSKQMYKVVFLKCSPIACCYCSEFGTHAYYHYQERDPDLTVLRLLKKFPPWKGSRSFLSWNWQFSKLCINWNIASNKGTRKFTVELQKVIDQSYSQLPLTVIVIQFRMIRFIFYESIFGKGSWNLVMQNESHGLFFKYE